jgi:hypothetical protein
LFDDRQAVVGNVLSALEELKVNVLHTADRVPNESFKGFILFYVTSLVAWSSEFLTTSREVPGSIPGLSWEFSLAWEDPHSEHGQGIMFKAPPGTPRSYITSVWTYGIELWGCASHSNIEIIRYQSKLLRTITNAPRYVTNNNLH